MKKKIQCRKCGEWVMVDIKESLTQWWCSQGHNVMDERDKEHKDLWEIGSWGKKDVK